MSKCSTISNYSTQIFELPEPQRGHLAAEHFHLLHMKKKVSLFSASVLSNQTVAALHEHERERYTKAL